MRLNAPADDLFICIAQNKVNRNVAAQYQSGAAMGRMDNA
jgi:hypothetical protein